MIRILTVVLALLASSVFAQDIPSDWKEVSPGTYRVGKRIVVTGNIPPELLPAFIKDMTADQFKDWAKAKNDKAYADAAQRHEDYVLNRGPLTTMNLASSSASHNTRFGGGLGVGGYGGAGGYSGYNSSNGMGGGVNYPYGYYGGVNGSSGGSNGFGSGFTFQGNNINTTDTASSQSWVKTFPDLNDGGGGPVMLINPYCFDYWRTHTE